MLVGVQNSMYSFLHIFAALWMLLLERFAELIVDHLIDDNLFS